MLQKEKYKILKYLEAETKCSGKMRFLSLYNHSKQTRALHHNRTSSNFLIKEEPNEIQADVLVKPV